MNNSEIRAKARESLKGNWGNGILGCILPGIIVGASFYIIEFLFMIPLISHSSESYYSNNIFQLVGTLILVFILIFAATLVFGCSFAYGIPSFFLNLSRTKQPKINDIFEGFKRFKECFLTYLFVSIFSFLWSLLFIVPLSILIGLTASASESNSSFAIFSILTVLVYIATIIGIYWITSRYALVFYLMKDSEKTSPFNYIKQSKELMKGKSSKYILLYLSFIGWYFLCILTCGLGIIVLAPYVRTSVATFYDDVLNEGKQLGKIQYVELKQEFVTNEFNSQYNNGIALDENDKNF